MSLALSILMLGATIGNALSYGIGGYIIATLQGHDYHLPVAGTLHPWQMTFVLTGLPGIVLAFLIFVIPEPARTGSLSRDRLPTFEVFRFMARERRFFVGHILGFALMAMTNAGSAMWAAVVLIRTYHIEVAHVGLAMMASVGAGGVFGFLICGSLVDRLFRRGIRDAHLVFFMVTVPIGAVVILLGAIGGSPVAFMASLAVTQVVTSFSGASAAALQIVTPNELRGQVSAVYLFVTGMIGIGLGGTAIALLTEHVFADPAKVNLAIASLYILSAPATLLLLGMARKPMRLAVGGG